MSRVLGGIVIAGVVALGLSTPERGRPLPSPSPEPVPRPAPAPTHQETAPSPGAADVEPVEIRAPSEPVAEPAAASTVEPAAAPARDRVDDSAVWGRYALEFRSSVDLALSEIVSYDAGTALLLATCDEGLAFVDLSDPDGARVIEVLDVATAVGLTGASSGLSHVSVDPMGRGVAAVTVLPSNKGTVPGRLAFVSLERRAVIGSLVVGYGPDACEFSPDGRFLVVANEGEWVARTDGAIDDPPPSVTIVRLASVKNEYHFETLEEADLRTVHFAGEAMAAVEREGFAFDPSRHLRLSPAQKYTPGIDIEPESVAMTNSTAYVSLQENNAVAVIDLEAATLERLEALGAVEFLADVSDKDGPNLTATIKGLPMPDQVKAFEAGGRCTS